MLFLNIAVMSDCEIEIREEGFLTGELRKYDFISKRRKVSLFTGVRCEKPVQSRSLCDMTEQPILFFSLQVSLDL